jgi:hypothetical protein
VIVRRFIAGTDPDYGEFGFRPAWIRSSNYFTGVGCAHDILEHVARPGWFDPAEDECMAMGASVFVRSMADWYEEKMPMNVNTSAQHVSATITHDILPRVRTGEQSLGMPPATRPLRDSDVEQEFSDIMRHAAATFDYERGDDEKPWYRRHAKRGRR